MGARLPTSPDGLIGLQCCGIQLSGETKMLALALPRPLRLEFRPPAVTARNGGSLPHVAPALAPSCPAPADEVVLRALVERIRQENDIAAFDQLYHLTRHEVARTLTHLVGKRADIEDLLQETYLRLLGAVKSFRGEAKFRTFLYRVCANVALMHLRWKRRRPEEPADQLPELPAAGADPEGEASRREAARLVERALERLSPKKRVVFVYHELCGMGPEEIARVVGTSPNTVRSRLHHGRLEFHQAMQELVKLGSGGGHGLR